MVVLSFPKSASPQQNFYVWSWRPGTSPCEDSLEPEEESSIGLNPFPELTLLDANVKIFSADIDKQFNEYLLVWPMSSSAEVFVKEMS